MPGAGHIYTSSKIAGELLCHDYWQLYQVPVTILRYGIPYGPRMRDTLVIPIFLKKALAGVPLTIAGDGSQYRNFVYVEDLAQAHLLAMDEKAVNQTYNLEGMRKVTVREVAETINGLLGGGVKIEYTPVRLGDYAGKEVSSEKASRELGWEPTVDFEKGMRRTITWYKEKMGLR
jgi:UDP-glucose 4-epimerase